MYKDKFIKPPIKWVGGKTQIIDDIISKFPSKFNNYHEIFLGGGSVLLALLKMIENKQIKVTGKIYAYDINETLINLYTNIQSNPQNILDEIKIFIDDYNNCIYDKENTIRNPQSIEEGLISKESYYYWCRKQYNELSQEDKNKPIGSALLIFLNKTCFRGLYRVSSNGFNVPYGNYQTPTIINSEHIFQIHNLIKIKNVEFKCCSFDESLKNVKKGDFVYLDPPYVPEKKESFVDYNIDGFTVEKHNELFKLCNDMKLNNIKFLLSNSDVELVQNSFPKEKFNIIVLSCKRAINSKKPESKTNELLIM